jgi:hypothetical protein
MKQTKTLCCFSVLLVLAAAIGAQQFNSVPLGHAAYDLIEMGSLRGIVTPPSLARPWPEYAVKEKLRSMLDASAGKLSLWEQNIVSSVLDSFKRKAGFNYDYGESASGTFTFEASLNWESFFSFKLPDFAVGSVNMAGLYASGDIGNFISWNCIILGGFLYIEQENLGLHEHSDSSLWTVKTIPSSFPYTFTKQWDGGVLAPANTGSYTAWPDEFSFAYGFMPEVNAVFFDRRLELRLGRLRRDWGPVSGSSLVMNAQARPFAALEGTLSPFPWLDISFLNGGLEYFREDDQWPNEGPVKNMFSLAQAEFTTGKYFYFDIGGSAVWPKQPNLAFHADLEFRLPNVFKIWGSLFIDRIDRSESFPDNFFLLDANAFAYQGGLKAVVNWLPLAAFTLRYTKIEPYCYANANSGGGWFPSDSAYSSGGEALGFYLPPNSDELLVRLESMFLPQVRAYIQYQIIRHGVDYGYGAVDGSSLRDSLEDVNSIKYFLMDGVYQWNNVFKIGGTYRFKAAAIPSSIYMETGVVVRRFTINGKAGTGSEGDYEALSNDIYRPRTDFVFSFGFKLFP